ncbi:MAG: oxidoreductase [Massilia sp.]|nr:oxidoreductase [Massilia sp.]
MSDLAPAIPDPRPLPPIEPALEDCCGSGCPNCIFDVYQMLLANYKQALAEWEARHPEAAAHSAPD